MTFPILALPDLPLLDILKQMDTVDKIRFYLSLDNHMKRQLTKYVSLGDIQVLNFGKDATLRIGNMHWAFYRKWRFNPTIPVVETRFPLPYKLLHVSDGGTPVWISEVENPSDAVLTVALWILEMFPRTKRTSFLIDLHSSANVEKLIALNLRKFEEGRIAADQNCDSATNQFFNETIKNWDTALISTAGINSYKKFAFLKNLKKNEEMPVKRAGYFTILPLLDRQCEYVIFSGSGVNEAHLQNLVNEWMTETTKNVIMIKVKSVKNLDLSKIVSETEEWNDEEMEKYRTMQQFQKYFEEKGAIIRNPSGKIVSIHKNETEETFAMVAWDTPPTQKTLGIHNDLPLY